MAYQAGPVYPCNPYTARSESTKLAVDPKGEKLVYTNGRCVVIRDLNHTNLSHVYTQHTQTATVARISPSGYYCASADIGGSVRIWDVTQPENVLKLAARPLGGKINDLAWDGESKRIVVGGEGKDKFGAAFLIDSGSSCGEITGHSKAISIRHQRPFRAVSGSDDTSVILHTGAPFKYDKILSSHNRFVRDVAFSPNGNSFASVASDGRLLFYEGQSGESQGSVGNEGGSSLMACSWSPDSDKIATAGADGVVTIWNVETQKSSQTYSVGTDVFSQQNGVVYASNATVVSLSLSGVLTIFDTRESSGAKWRSLHGPTKAVTASTITASSEKEKTFYAGSFDGSIKRFSVGSGYGDEQGACSPVEGAGHGARVAAMSSETGKIWTTGWDDKVTCIEDQKFSSTSLSTKAQPAGLAATPNGVYVASAAGLEIHPTGHATSVHAGATTAVAAYPGPNGDLVAFGSESKKVVLASITDGAVKVQAEFEDNKGEILSLAFSKDGTLLAAGDTKGRIILVDVVNKTVVVGSKWTFHTGRVTSLEFSEDGKRLVSGGLDEAIYVWEVEKPPKNLAMKNSHPGGVSGVSWLEGNSKLVSSGQDGCVRTWIIPRA
ncbi:WD-repeat protein [Tremella mesenterica]|uniref:WD-repeat protein n=1 Tax=Tremella mesenterica TaxID=5217 RepID=A0A4Q1BR36_TREME|nr:WD-repeat protein [Tremella mesenterica]